MNYVNVKVEFLNPFVHKCFSCVYIKMTNTLSAKYYQENKERLQNELAKDIIIYLKKKKKKTKCHYGHEPYRKSPKR